MHEVIHACNEYTFVGSFALLGHGGVSDGKEGGRGVGFSMNLRFSVLSVGAATKKSPIKV